MTAKKEEVTDDIKKQYQDVCKEYETLINTNPGDLSGDEIIEHHKKCKEVLARKKKISEQFFKRGK